MFGFQGLRAAPERAKARPGTGPESVEISRLLGSFKPGDSARCREVEAKFRGSTNAELVSVARILIYTAQGRQIPFPEEFARLCRVLRRSRPLILKWFHDYWEIVEPILPDVDLVDKHFAPIR
jgi:hypothetical protein